MSNLVWKKPPVPNFRRVRSPYINWSKVAVSLQSKPGKWARVKRCMAPTTATSLASALRNGSLAKGAFGKRRGFEVVSRGNEIYARYKKAV